MNELSGKQRRYLKSLANRLKASVRIGKEGITPALLQAIEEAYNTKELIKIRIEHNCPVNREKLADQLSQAASSYLIQILGHTILLYRPDLSNPRIDLPG